MPSSQNNTYSDSDFNTASCLPVSADDRKYKLNYLNTNARSLRPKITSLVDAFQDLDITYAVVTETWFSEGDKLKEEAENLLLGKGLGAVTLSRPPGNAGFSHGGVAFIYKDSVAKVKKYDFPNPDLFEVLCCQMTVHTIKRKFFVISVYMPPGYRVGRARACFRHVNDLVLDIKNKHDAPYINIAGDFNQWQITEALLDYPDIVENSGGPTRKDRVIDRCFCNWPDSVVDTAVLPPLETEEVEPGSRRRSDHKLVLTSSLIDKIPPPNWQKFTFRPYSEEKAALFHNWMKEQSWHEVLNANSANDKANALQLMLDDAMNAFFPEKTVRLAY